MGLQGSGLECPDSGSGSRREFLLLLWLRLTAPEPRQGQDKTLASSRALGSRWLDQPPNRPAASTSPALLASAGSSPSQVPRPFCTSPGPRCAIRCSCPRAPVESSSKNNTHCQLPYCRQDARRHVWLALNFLGVPFRGGREGRDDVWLPRLPIYICSYFLKRIQTSLNIH